MSAFTSPAFTQPLVSTYQGISQTVTPAPTPAALVATTNLGFASTVSGASLMGYGTTNDVALLNRAGTVVAGVGPNTTTFNVVGQLDLSAATAGQIKFPATQNSSANANTLDDYEEGTWTPSDASGAGLGVSNGGCSYVKIGTWVCVTFDITLAVNVSGTASLIGGLPYASSGSGSPNAWSGSIWCANGGVTETWQGASMATPGGSTTTANLRGSPNIAISNQDASNILVRGNYLYRASA